MILLYDNEKRKFFEISDNIEIKEAPYITLEKAARMLGITKQGVTRKYKKHLSVVKSIDGKRAILLDDVKRLIDHE